MESRLATTIRIILALVMVAPLIVMADPLPNTLFPFVVGKALWTRSLIEVALGLWIILLLRDPSRRLPRSWTVSVLGIYVSIALLSTLFSVSPTRSLWSTYERMQGWVDLVHWFVFVVVLVSTYTTWAHWRALLNFNIGVGIVIGLLGIVQFLDIYALPYLEYRGRLDVTLGNPTYLGGYALVGFFIAGGFLIESLLDRSASQATGHVTDRRRRRRSQRSGSAMPAVPPVYLWRTYWIAAIILNFAMVYLSATRGAAVALVVGILVLGLAYSLRGNSRRLRVAAIGTSAAVVALSSMLLVFAVTRAGTDDAMNKVPEGMVERMLKVGLSNKSTERRITSAQIGVRAFLERPLLGWGPENYTIGYDRHAPSETFAQGSVTFDQAHNKVIEELTTKGLLGLIGYLALWVSMLVVFLRRAWPLPPGRQAFALLIGAALVGYFTQNLFLFDTPGTLPQFYLLVGFVIFLDAPIPRRAGSRSDRTGAHAATSSPRFPRPRLTTGEMATGSMVLVVVLGIVAAISLLNVRPLVASSQAIYAVDGRVPWERRFEALEDSVSTFAPLSNFVRIAVFDALGSNWGTLEGDQVSAALEVVELQGPPGMRTEPEEWRLFYTMARVYQQAGEVNEEFVAEARGLVDRAVELAPSRVEVRRQLVAQHIVEDDPLGALRLIESYVEDVPETAHRFEALRDRAERALERTGAVQGNEG